MTEYERKYLLRLSSNAIEHAEFARWGKRAIQTIERLGEKGFAERLDFDGNAVGADDPDAVWQITGAGLAKVGK